MNRKINFITSISLLLTSRLMQFHLKCQLWVAGHQNCPKFIMKEQRANIFPIG